MAGIEDTYDYIVCGYDMALKISFDYADVDTEVEPPAVWLLAA